MENQLGEIRNLLVMNMKRMDILEKKVNDLNNKNHDIDQNIEIINNKLEYDYQQNTDYLEINYLSDIFSHKNTSYEDFVINNDNESNDEIVIPADFYE